MSCADCRYLYESDRNTDRTGNIGTMITLGKTKSVCPICMKVLTAKKCIGEDGIYLVKECDIHGKFQTLIWEGTAAEYLSWGRENLSAETPVNPKIKEKSCPDNCGLCEEHERKGCCMILEVTKRCNMHCPVCFASAGECLENGDLSIDEIEKQYDFLMDHGGPFNIQLSGGEPTMREDLPEIIHMGREKGFTFFSIEYQWNPSCAGSRICQKTKKKQD